MPATLEKPITLTLPQETYRAAKVAAKSRNVSFRDFVLIAINEAAGKSDDDPISREEEECLLERARKSERESARYFTMDEVRDMVNAL